MAAAAPQGSGPTKGKGAPSGDQPRARIDDRPFQLNASEVLALAEHGRYPAHFFVLQEGSIKTMADLLVLKRTRAQKPLNKQFEGMMSLLGINLESKVSEDKELAEVVDAYESEVRKVFLPADASGDADRDESKVRSAPGYKGYYNVKFVVQYLDREPISVDFGQSDNCLVTFTFTITTKYDVTKDMPKDVPAASIVLQVAPTMYCALPESASFKGADGRLYVKSPVFKRVFVQQPGDSYFTSFGDDKKVVTVAAPKGFIGSTLLTDEYKIQLLAWEEIKDNKTWTLLYKGSRDGFDAAKFHNLCDNKGSTMTVIRTANNRTFGGYASVRWTSANAYAIDNASWLFSLDQRLKFPAINGNPNHVYCGGDRGPTFGGGHDLYVSNQCNAHNGSSSNLGSSFSNPSGNKHVLEGAQNFMVSDIEVFWRT